MILENITLNSTTQKQVIDITPLLSELVDKHQPKQALLTVFVKHTTASVTTADLDPGTDLDMLDAFAQIIPQLPFRHAHNPKHTPDHILSSIIGTSLTIPILNGHLDLGTWQRVVIVELDGPRSRDLVISLLT